MVRAHNGYKSLGALESLIREIHNPKHNLLIPWMRRARWHGGPRVIYNKAYQTLVLPRGGQFHTTLCEYTPLSGLPMLPPWTQSICFHHTPLISTSPGCSYTRPLSMIALERDPSQQFSRSPRSRLRCEDDAMKRCHDDLRTLNWQCRANCGQWRHCASTSEVLGYTSITSLVLTITPVH